MKKHFHYEYLQSRVGYYTALLSMGALMLIGLAAAYYMEHHGHVVTGMTNQIVWGMPHVFAVFLIIAASGILNVASIGTVFGRTPYKPLGRLSAVMAAAALAGGLVILVLDLGRPDRLIVAMTEYNFRSIFAWNIYLYNGFFAVVLLYLYTQMSQDFRVRRYYTAAGTLAFVWRLILTTGTGSIFGWLVARQAYDLAVFAPMFIALSFSFGLAIFILLMTALMRGDERPVGVGLVNRMGRLLGVFLAAAAYFTVVWWLTDLYAAEHRPVVQHLFFSGNVYSWLYWLGFIGVGTILPMLMVFSRSARTSMKPVIFASILTIIGGISLVYFVIIGGQSYPLVLFPGKEVKSSFFDGVVANYAPTMPEILLGIGGMAMGVAITLLAAKVLRILPVSLADAEVDPHLASGEVKELKKAA